MIIFKKFVWIHLGKTGGTSITNMLEHFKEDMLFNDDTNQRKVVLRKHAEYNKTTKKYIEKRFKMNNYGVIMNLRPLPNWVVSHAEYLNKFYNKKYTREDILNGMISNIQADQRIKDYGAEYVTDWIRTENLSEDFINIIGKYIEIPTNIIDELHNTKLLVNNSYNKNISKWYSKNELEDLYNKNPYYANLEKKIYGKLNV